MDGRVECRVLRRSGGGREVAEVEVWMDGRMECVVLRRSRSKWRRQRGDGVEEDVTGGDGLHHTANREGGGRFHVPRFLLCAMRHLNFSQKGKLLTSEILQPPPPPIPKFFLVVYLLKLSSECLVSYDPHFPGNDGTNKSRVLVLVLVYGLSLIHI